MFCSKCGKQLPDEARFCGGCGAPVQPAKNPEVTKEPKQPEKPEKTKNPRGGKTFPVKKVLSLVLCLAILVGVVLGALAVFGKKTVYLVTENVVENPYQISTTKTEYDEHGRVVRNELHVEYTTVDNSDYSVVQELIYDSEGKLVKAKVKSDGEKVTVEYHYDKNGHLETIEWNDREAEVECDKEGRITEISWSSGGSEYTAEYSYHKNGSLAEAVLDYGMNKYSYVYDDRGNQVENCSWANGRKTSATESVYNDDDVLVEMTMLYYDDGKLASETVLSYEYDRSNMLTCLRGEADEDGEEMSVQIITKDEGLEREFLVKDIIITGDMDLETLMEGSDLRKNDAVLVYEYDEHGNLLKTETAGLNVTENTYTAFKLPRDYRKIPAQDPRYFIPGLL